MCQVAQAKAAYIALYTSKGYTLQQQIECTREDIAFYVANPGVQDGPNPVVQAMAAAELLRELCTQHDLQILQGVNQDLASEGMRPVPMVAANIEYYADQLWAIADEVGTPEDYLAEAAAVIALAKKAAK